MEMFYPVTIKTFLECFSSNVVMRARIFILVVATKSNSQNRLNVGHDVRITQSKTKPQFDALIDNEQEHPLHKKNWRKKSIETFCILIRYT